MRYSSALSKVLLSVVVLICLVSGGCSSTHEDASNTTNNGPYSINAARHYEAGTFWHFPKGMVSADLDLDGSLDVVTAGFSFINVLVGNELGEFEIKTSTDYLSGSDSPHLFLHDIGDDGYPDVVLYPDSWSWDGQWSKGILVWLSEGPDLFVNDPLHIYMEEELAALAVGDVTGDGRGDLILGTNSGMLDIRTSNGDGSFTSGQLLDLPDIPADLIVSDFKADGWQDILVCGRDQGIFLIPNTGHGNFGEYIHVSAITGTSATVHGDFNGDNHSDLVLAAESPWFGILLGDGQGAFTWQHYPYWYPTLRLDAFDMNSDSVLDLALLTQFLPDQTDQRLFALFAGTGSGEMILWEEFGLEYDYQDFALADVDRDKGGDVLLLHYSLTGLGVFLGTDNHFPWPHRFGTWTPLYNFEDFVCADFNGDGQSDCLTFHKRLYGPKNLLLFTSEDQGQRFREEVILTDVNAAYLATGDLDQDGNADAVLLDENIVVLEGDGAGGFTRLTQGFDLHVNGIFALDDFNEDGLLDIVYSFNWTVAVMLGHGDCTFGPPITTNCLCGMDLVVGDFDGDGHRDVCTRGWNGFSLLLGNGSGSLQRMSTLETDGIYRTMCAGDCTSDGRDEIIISEMALADGIGSYYRLLTLSMDDFVHPTVPPGTVFYEGIGGKYSGSMLWEDIDLDGESDLVVADSELHIFYSATTTPYPHTGRLINIGGEYATHVATGDFNQDGGPDLVSSGRLMALYLSHPAEK